LKATLFGKFTSKVHPKLPSKMDNSKSNSSSITSPSKDQLFPLRLNYITPTLITKDKFAQTCFKPEINGLPLKNL